MGRDLEYGRDVWRRKVSCFFEAIGEGRKGKHTERIFNKGEYLERRKGRKKCKSYVKRKDEITNADRMGKN